MTSSKESNPQLDSLNRLGDLIEAELKLVEHELTPLLQKKQQALVENDLDPLQQLSQRETALSSELAQLEARRIASLASLASAFSLSANAVVDMTLSELINLLPMSDELEKITDQATRLEQSIYELEMLNQTNFLLTRNLLEYTEIVMRLVTQGTAKPGYGADGRVNNGQATRKMLDDRI